MIPEFYNPRPEWSDQIELIGELLGRISVLESLSGDNLETGYTARSQSSMFTGGVSVGINAGIDVGITGK